MVKDELNGGPPYFIGEISSQKIEEFFDFIEKKDLFKSNINHKQNYGPDSTYTAIAAVRDSNYFEIGSWHELFEAEPNIAVTSNGVESLDGRTRQEVLSEQPQDYKDFRNIWSQLRQASKKHFAQFLPAASESLGAPGQGRLGTLPIPQSVGSR